MGRSLFQGGMFWIAMTIAFCLLGISHAGWQEPLKVTSTVVTGTMEVAFTDALVKDQMNARAHVVYQADRLQMTIEKPQNPIYVRFEYVISNLGSVPVTYETKLVSAPEMFLVRQSPVSGILEVGEEASGFIEIRNLNKISLFEGDDSFMMQLDYEQATWEEVVLMK